MIEGAEKVDFPSTLTEGSLAAFQDEDQRELDFKEFMLGEQHQLGGRHDLDSKGLSTDNVTVREEALLDPHTQPPLPQEADFVQQLDEPVVPQETDWKQAYGNSENEKGELRKQLQATMDENFQLKQTQPAQVAELPKFFGQPSAPPQQPQVAQSVPQTPFDPTTMPRLVDKEDGEPMLAEDVDRVLREKVAPAFYGMQQQIDQAQAATAQANQRLFDAEKARIGITPQEERVMVAKNPWLQGMNDPNSYIQAIGVIKAREDALAAQAQPVPAQATPTLVATPGQRMEVRRRTFVESSSQTAGPSQPDSRALDPNVQFSQEWAKAMTLPYEQQASAKRELLKGRGARTVSGYRDPSVLTS